MFHIGRVLDPAFILPELDVCKWGVPDGIGESVVVGKVTEKEDDVARGEGEGKCARGCGWGRKNGGRM